MTRYYNNNKQNVHIKMTSIYNKFCNKQNELLNSKYNVIIFAY
jgi:hypothetical protein